MKALIFDCDGVLVDTERDGHRVAFNEAFARQGLEARWSVEEYGELLAVAGGKERMRHYFERRGWPAQAVDRDSFIQELHKLKTELYMKIIEEGRLPLRPGVARLVDEAIAAGLVLAICSTSNERAVRTVARVMLGEERVGHFAAILAGDVVSKKKPDPEIYLLARDTLQVDPRECVVVEDSRNGLLSAKAAGMWCIITKSCYTGGEDFGEADAVYPDLGDPPDPMVSVRDLERLTG
ncbi:MAG: HAD-IA family hydrolase [Spirochaetales bacterium]|nr:HAD-IA family hydrolase [Spirochaetales bacterium]